MFKNLRAELNDNEAAKIYLLVSPEAFLIEEAIKTITTTWLGVEYDPLQIITLNSKELTSDQFLTSVLTFDIFVQKRLALLRDVDQLANDVLTNIAESISQLPPKTLLICTVVAKKAPHNKLIKTVKQIGKIIDIPMLKGRELYRLVRQKADELGLSIDEEVEAELVATFSNDLYLLYNELVKLSSFVGSNKEQVGIKDLQAVMGKSSLHSIFNLTDALGAKELSRARQDLQDLLQSGESPIYVITMLQWHLANLWQCKASAIQDGQALAKLLNIHPYVASKSIRQANNFTLEELEESYLLTVETEYRLKTGKAPRIDVELDRLLVKSITNC